MDLKYTKLSSSRRGSFILPEEVLGAGFRVIVVNGFVTVPDFDYRIVGNQVVFDLARHNLSSMDDVHVMFFPGKGSMFEKDTD